jgi:surface carbohydrate biosynthesis protein
LSEIWLYLPMQVITRELDAKLLLTYYAVKQNYSVLLGKQKKIYENAEFLPKGIFLFKGNSGGGGAKKYKPIVKELGHAAVELDEEALFFDENRYLQKRTDEKDYEILDQVYCWGKGQRDTLANAYPQFKEKFHLTGHPRFDLLMKKFRSLYSDEVKRIKKLHGDFILINTRFTSYNRKGGFGVGKDDMQKLYEHFIEMIKELSPKYPNLNIVIRPHPGENCDSYREELSNCKNVFVAHEGSVVKWILASKLVIHNGCTTGIESFLLDKPVISYMPFKSEEIDEDLPNEVSYKAFTISELFSFIDSLEKGEINHIEEQQQINERKKILANYYEAMDENYAYRNIIRLLNKINVKGESSSENSFLRNNPLRQKGPADKEFTEKEIITFFNKLNKIEKTENKIKVRKLAFNLFEIRSDNN